MPQVAWDASENGGGDDGVPTIRIVPPPPDRNVRAASLNAVLVADLEGNLDAPTYGGDAQSFGRIETAIQWPGAR